MQFATGNSKQQAAEPLTAEQRFWQWFQANETALFQFEIDPDQQPSQDLLDELSEQLALYHHDLMFEITPLRDGKRELYISADGIVEAFPAVEALVDAAPQLQRWSVVAFRPRMQYYSEYRLNYAGVELDPTKVWVAWRVDGDSFDLIVFHPEYSEAERNIYISASYLLLDMALGEYDVATGIRYIDHQKLPCEPLQAGLTPFAQLREIFDRFKLSAKH